MSDYKCKDCGIGCAKLWGTYNLRCTRCVMKKVGKEDTVDDSGFRVNSRGVRTNRIGRYVPAVLNITGDGFLPYKFICSPAFVTSDYGAQWRALPTYVWSF